MENNVTDNNNDNDNIADNKHSNIVPAIISKRQKLLLIVRFWSKMIGFSRF